MLRGMPSVNRAVRAASRGKETVMHPSHHLRCSTLAVT
jgi:hypothetical protein